MENLSSCAPGVRESRAGSQVDVRHQLGGLSPLRGPSAAATANRRIPKLLLMMQVVAQNIENSFASDICDTEE
jgi:hypothetical protein